MAEQLQTSRDKPKRGFDWAVVLPASILVVSTIVMIAPMVFGIEILGVKGSKGVAELLASFAKSPIAPFAVIAVFTVLGLTGFPQFMMILGASAIFGAFYGFVLSWIGTMVSALLGFWIGRISGGALLRRYGGKTVKRASEILGRRGIVASAIVRLIPSGPFVMVNMIAGASHMKWWQFAIGTGLGSIPKTAVVAFLGGHLGSFLRERDPVDLAIAVGALLASIFLGLWVRRRFFRPLAKEQPGPPSSGS